MLSNKKGQLLYGIGLSANGAPGEIRTPDPLVRSQVLYPTELRARSQKCSDFLDHLRREITDTLKLIK
jgi:hypothetical protein